MEQRRKAIVSLVDSQGSIRFAQLKEAFPDVSEMTLRTDLKVLDQQRLLVRIHGGAKSVGQVVGTDGLLGRRMSRNPDAKAIIARKALALLQPNTTVYLDSGSTTTALARLVPDEPFLLFTNGISCATELARLDKPTVHMPGGILNRFSMSICGGQSVEAMSLVHFDQMFLGVTAYSPDTGFSCGVDAECRLKQTVLRRSEQVIVLMDSSKINTQSTFTICDLSEVDIIVSDGNLPTEFVDRCTRLGVQVY